MCLPSQPVRAALALRSHRSGPSTTLCLQLISPVSWSGVGPILHALRTVWWYLHSSQRGCVPSVAHGVILRVP